MGASFSETLHTHINVIHSLTHLENDILTALNKLIEVIRGGGKILLAGNGGSAADAQHIAAELIIRLNKDITRPALPALALTTDSSILTAAGNDIGFENVFLRQTEAWAGKNDLLWLISTSGNSANLLRAAQKARANNCYVLGLLGNDGGHLAALCDHSITIPTHNTQHIQEAHMVIYHFLCEHLETALYG